MGGESWLKSLVYKVRLVCTSDVTNRNDAIEIELKVSAIFWTKRQKRLAVDFPVKGFKGHGYRILQTVVFGNHVLAVSEFFQLKK